MRWGTLRRTCVFTSDEIRWSRSALGAFGLCNSDAQFFMLRWDGYGFDKKVPRDVMLKHVFLHPVGSAGHVMYSGASRERNIDTLFFMLRWAWCGFHKKCTRTCYGTLMFASGGICRSRSAFWCV
jgi:hypothetical protein